MDLNDQSHIKGKTWGRVSKKEYLELVEYQDRIIQMIQHQFVMYKIKTAWLP